MTNLTVKKASAVRPTTMDGTASTKFGEEVGSTGAAELYRNLGDVIWESRRSSPETASGVVCYVIVSTSSLIWTTLTLIASGLIGVALITPYWLVSSPSRRPHFLSAANRSHHVGTVSIGLFNECTGQRKPEIADILGALAGGGTSGECGTFVSGFDMPNDVFPDAWKSALILLIAANVLMSFTDFSAIVSICIQSIFGKSIFTVSGLLQSIAGAPNCLCSRLYRVAQNVLIANIYETLKINLRDFC